MLSTEILFIYNLRKLANCAGKQSKSAWAALATLVLANLAHVWVGQVPLWAGAHLAWAADWALGRVALVHLGDVTCALHWEHAHALDAGGVLTAGIAGVLADLTDQLGADGAGDGDIRVGVLDVHRGPLWVTVVLGLGGVLQALVRLDDELALSGLHDDATLHVHKGGGLGGGAGHFYNSLRI